MHRVVRLVKFIFISNGDCSLARGFSGYVLAAIPPAWLASLYEVSAGVKIRWGTKRHRQGRSANVARPRRQCQFCCRKLTFGVLRGRLAGAEVSVARPRSRSIRTRKHAVLLRDFCTISAQSYGSQSYPGQKYRRCRARRFALRFRHRRHFRYDAFSYRGLSPLPRAPGRHRNQRAGRHHSWFHARRDSRRPLRTPR